MTDDNKVLEDLARCSREFRDITGKIDTVDIDVVITNYRKYISHIENDIKRWMLSSKDSIINFYSLIKNGDMKNKEICLPDTNYLIHSYQDYYAGLLSYLKEISNIVRKDFNPDKKIELIRKLGLANSKDESFTDLCGEEKDVTFSDAILNIECILDLIETINTIKNDLDEKPFSKFKIGNSDKSFYIESKDNIKILSYYEGTVYIHTLNNFIRVEDFKNVMLKDMV